MHIAHQAINCAIHTNPMNTETGQLVPKQRARQYPKFVKMYLYSESFSSDAEYLLTNSFLCMTAYCLSLPFLLKVRAGTMNLNDFQPIRKLYMLMSVLV